MIVKGKFKGVFGEPGYAPTISNYVLKLSFKRKPGSREEQLWIQCLSHPFCDSIPYDSMKAFLNNWDIL